MTFKNLRILPLLAAAVLLTPSLPLLGDTTEKPMVEFRAVGWNQSIPDLHYDIDGQPRALPLHRAAATGLQRYAGPVALTFYRKSEENPARQPIVTVTLHPPPKQNLVIIWLDPEGVHRATVLADDPDALAPGQVRFVNHTKRELLFQCTRQSPFSLAPDADRTLPAAEGGIGVKVAMRTGPGGNWELALMNGIPLEPDERATVLVTDPSSLAASPSKNAPDSSINAPRPLALFTIRDRVTAP